MDWLIVAIVGICCLTFYHTLECCLNAGLQELRIEKGIDKGRGYEQIVIKCSGCKSCCNGSCNEPSNEPFVRQV